MTPRSGRRFKPFWLRRTGKTRIWFGGTWVYFDGRLSAGHESSHEALRPVSRVRDRIGQLRFTGIRVGTCVPVLCELEAALPSSNRGQVYRRALQRLLVRVRLWPLESETALLYGEIFRELRKLGRVLSQVDMMLAALARQKDLTLATSDKDFEALPDVRTESWL